MLKEHGIDKKVISICFMIIMLCACFYLLGYGRAYQVSADHANSFIEEFVREYNCGYTGNSPMVNYDFGLNVTGDTELK